MVLRFWFLISARLFNSTIGSYPGNMKTKGELGVERLNETLRLKDGGWVNESPNSDLTNSITDLITLSGLNAFSMHSLYRCVEF